jgi:hypothetical protein
MAAAAAAAEAAAAGSSGVADFVHVVGASDSFEVCRTFAAMLQLVNNRCALPAEGWLVQWGDHRSVGACHSCWLGCQGQAAGAPASAASGGSSCRNLGSRTVAIV